MVLDVMLPGLNGHEVCRRLQVERPVPMPMLTARDDEIDLLVGLGIDGASRRVWGWADASGTRTVGSHVKLLRRQLGADLVATVSGVG